MNPVLAIIQSVGQQAASQVAGPFGWLASLVLKAAVAFLDYWGVKHELKKQADQKLEDFEKAIADTSLSEAEKDEARRNFLK